MLQVRSRPERSEERCPICRDEDITDKPIIRCGVCGTVCHAECRNGHGGCPTLGCRNSPHVAVSEKSATEPEVDGQDWQEEKTGVFSAPAPLIVQSASDRERLDALQKAGTRKFLHEQLPQLLMLMAIPATVIALAWLLVQIIKPFFEGRILTGLLRVSLAIGSVLLTNILYLEIKKAKRW